MHGKKERMRITPEGEKKKRRKGMNDRSRQYFKGNDSFGKVLKVGLTASVLGLSTFMKAPLALASLASFLVTFLVSRNLSWGSLCRTKYLRKNNNSNKDAC